MKNVSFFILFLSMSIFGQKYETHSFETLFTQDNFEIREYDSVMKARAFSNSGNNNFMKLFRYISGNNEKKEKISMTTPVYMKEQNNSSIMEFVLPAKFNENNVSKPLSDEVELYMDSGGTYASISYGGYSNSLKRKKYRSQLDKIISKMNLDKIGDFIYLSYDSPYEFYNRKNEVIVKVNY